MLSKESREPSPSSSSSTSAQKVSLSKSLSASFGHESQPSAKPSESVSVLSSNPWHASTSPQTPSASESLLASFGHISAVLHKVSLSVSTQSTIESEDISETGRLPGLSWLSNKIISDILKSYPV